MADLSLRIKADFDEASRQFKALSAESDEARAKIEKFTEGFNDKQIDKFIDRQKLAGAAITATKGDLAGMEAQHAAYGREIERLIKSGLDPESDAVKKLRTEYENLGEKNASARQAEREAVEVEKEKAASLEELAKKTTALLAPMSEYEKKTKDLEQSQEKLKKEIESLIKQGVDPESGAVKALCVEYKELGERIEEAKRRKEQWQKTVEAAGAALKVLTAAAAAASAAILAAAQQTASAGDKYAKTARVIGMTAEQYQELEYAAKQSGVSSENLQSSLQKLNKSVADVKNGTGAFTKYLGENNPALLAQLKGVKSNEEAFNLLMGAMKNAPNEFERAALAQAAFGKSGQQLALMAEQGVEGLYALREEARKYGVISNETAEASEAYITAQGKVKRALEGVRNAFSEKLLPILTEFTKKAADALVKVMDFVRGIDDLPGKLEKIAWVVGAVAAALGTLIIIDKIAKAMTALNAVMLANPYALVAAAIAVVIVAVLALYKNWDMVQTYIQEGAENIKAVFTFLKAVVGGGLVAAFETVRAVVITLVDLIAGNLIRTIGKMLEVMGKLPFVGEQFKAASEAVKGFGDTIADVAQTARDAAAEAIKDATDITEASKKELEDRLAVIKAESDERRAALEEMEAENEKAQEKTKAAAATAAEETKKALEKSLRERIAILGQTEAQAEAERQDAFTRFMQARLEAEKLTGGDRIAWLREQAQLELDEENFSYEERLSAKAAFDAMIIDEEKKASAARLAIKQAELSAMAGFFGSMADLAAAAGKDSIAAAVASKGLAVAQAGINSYLAFTRALAELPFPANKIAAVSALASGLAQQIRIMSTPIPSAETGGRFIVPMSGANRVDGVGMMVNPGEEINVTPRGMADGGQVTQHIFKIDSQVIFDIVNRGLHDGNIYEYAPGWNL